MTLRELLCCDRPAGPNLIRAIIHAGRSDGLRPALRAIDDAGTGLAVEASARAITGACGFYLLRDGISAGGEQDGGEDDESSFHGGFPFWLLDYSSHLIALY